MRRRWPWLQHLFADADCDRTGLMDRTAFLDFVVEIVPREWVVERSFGWIIRWRRLVRAYEARLEYPRP